MKILATLLLGTLTITGSALCDIFDVPNFSFEKSSPGYGNPPGWSLFTDSTSPTFSSNTQVIVNNGSVYPLVSGVEGSQLVTVHDDHNHIGPNNPDPIVPPNGSLAGLVSGSLGNFAPNTTYALTGSVGLENAFGALNVGLALGTGTPSLMDVFPAPDSSFASLLINGNNLSDGTLEDETVTVDTSTDPSLVGKPIMASLILQSEYNYGRDALFDDIRLSSTPASDVLPEPSFLAMIGILGVVIIAVRVRISSVASAALGYGRHSKEPQCRLGPGYRRHTG